MMEPLEVASQPARQLPQFCSWRVDAEVMATYAFMPDWSQQRGYANLPW